MSPEPEGGSLKDGGLNCASTSTSGELCTAERGLVSRTGRDGASLLVITVMRVEVR